MKKLLQSKKLRTVAFVLALVLSAVLTTAATIAFFTDSKQSESVFTSGNVYISLTEAAVIPDSSGNLVEDTTKDRIAGGDVNADGTIVRNDYGIIFPGQTIYKDPTVTNTGSYDAWVAVKVIIEDGSGDIHRLFCYNDEDDSIDIEGLLTGGLLDEHVHVDEWCGIDDVCFNDRYAMVQHSNHANGKYEFYFIMQKPLQVGESVEIFDTMYVNDMFGNAEMAEFKELKITVQAFAVQTFGFSSALEAMEGAFADHFKNIR